MNEGCLAHAIGVKPCRIRVSIGTEKMVAKGHLIEFLRILQSFTAFFA
jgi:hypothetical protein